MDQFLKLHLEWNYAPAQDHQLTLGSLRASEQEECWIKIEANSGVRHAGEKWDKEKTFWSFLNI